MEARRDHWTRQVQASKYGPLASGDSVGERERDARKRQVAVKQQKLNSNVQMMLGETRPQQSGRQAVSSPAKLKQKRQPDSQSSSKRHQTNNSYIPTVEISPLKASSKSNRKYQRRSSESKPKLDDIRNWTSPKQLSNVKNGQVGFRNLGNTCYMNSILAALTRLSQFSNAVMSTSMLYSVKEKQSTTTIDDDNTPPCTQNVSEETPLEKDKLGQSDDFILKFLHNVASGVASGGLVGIRPSELKNAIASKRSTFRGNDQQDAHEFLVSFLDLLDTEISSIGGGEHLSVQPSYSKSLVKRLLQSKITKHFTCTECNRGIEKPELYTCLSVPLPKKITKKREITIEDKPSVVSIRSDDSSLTASDEENDLFRSDDEVLNTTPPPVNKLSGLLSASLEGESSISRNCEFCNSKNSRVSTQIAELPHYLVIHVNRFKIVQRGGEFTNFQVVKDDQAISISETLDLKPFTSSTDLSYPPDLNFSFSDSGEVISHPREVQSLKLTYSLRSVVHHFGVSTNSGHYVTDYLGDDLVWYNANDSVISPTTSPAREDSKTCYLLFYERDKE